MSDTAHDDEQVAAREREIDRLRAQLPGPLNDAMNASTPDNITIQGTHISLDEAKDCAIVLISLYYKLQILQHSIRKDYHEAKLEKAEICRRNGLPFTRSNNTPDYEIEQDLGTVEGISAMYEEKARMRAIELAKKVVAIDQAIREDVLRLKKYEEKIEELENSLRED